MSRLICELFLIWVKLLVMGKIFDLEEVKLAATPSIAAGGG